MLRVIAKHLSQELKKPIMVVNKLSGGTIAATLEATKAKPDGYRKSVLEEGELAMKIREMGD